MKRPKKLHRVLQKKQPSRISTPWFPTSPPYPQLQSCNPNMVSQAFKKNSHFCWHFELSQLQHWCQGARGTCGTTCDTVSDGCFFWRTRTQLRLYAVCLLAPSMYMCLVFRFLGFKEVLKSLCLSTVTVRLQKTSPDPIATACDMSFGTEHVYGLVSVFRFLGFNEVSWQVFTWSTQLIGNFHATDVQHTCNTRATQRATQRATRPLFL